MLVLSRKLNQSIHIGPNISISIVRVKGNVVQLGIDAPKEIHVLRSELIERDARAAVRSLQLRITDAQSSSQEPTDGEEATAADSETQAEILTAC